MDRARRIQALTTLQRIKEYELDAHATEMGAIRIQQAAIQTELDKLQERLENEARIPSPEAAPFLAGFLEAVENRRAYLNKQMAELDDKAALIEGRLFETYSEARTNEVVLDKNKDALKQEQTVAETAALEEIARNRYMRQKST